MASPMHDPAQLLAQMFESGQEMLRQLAGSDAADASLPSDPMAAFAAASQQVVGMQQEF